MRKLITILGLILVFISCGGTTKKEKSITSTSDSTSNKEEEMISGTPSADYSSLLTDYHCDMDMAEMAKLHGAGDMLEDCH
ncbi:MAG: hypothetical protein WBM43_11305 [Flavobacteriaceae bacterium]